jgi:hypothetical protein
MVKILKIILACVALQSGLASAQDFPRFEVFGAYSYLIYDISTAAHTNKNGWEASFAYNFNRRLAVEADVSGYYRYDYFEHLWTSHSQNHFYLLGPRFNHGMLFGHALFGAGHFGGHSTFHTEPGPSESADGFAMAFGGGVEKKIARHFAVRGGADWLFDRFSFPSFPHAVSLNQNSFRLNAGMVYVFGGR